MRNPDCVEAAKDSSSSATQTPLSAHPASRQVKLRVLVACEFSGIVRDAFAARGHDAWSCDLLASEREGQHIRDDVLRHLNDGWDVMIAHPPCTYICGAGLNWIHRQVGRRDKADDALAFVSDLLCANIARIALENPIGLINSEIRRPDQIIQPYWFGHEAQKATCFWLKNLPKLKPTNLVERGEIYVQKDGRKRGGAWTMKLPRTTDRWKIRSRTFQGIADAMADQWGGLSPKCELKSVR